MSSAAIFQGHAVSSPHVFGRGSSSSFASETEPIVFILDEDASLPESLELLIREKGWRCEIFLSAQDLLTYPPSAVPNCLVLGASLPGPDALALERRLAIERPGMPIIFIAGRIDVPTTVKAMKAGAVELFTKPFSDEALLSSIGEALERSLVCLAHESEIRALRDRYSVLSRREREVMGLVASGLLNKQVGGELGISEITVKAHRGQVMKKMKANSLADLVKMAGRLGLRSASTT
jgi:FixJ family two-component response regulator